MARKIARIDLTAGSGWQCRWRKARQRSPRQMLELAFVDSELPAKPDKLTPIFVSIDPRDQTALIIAVPVEGANLDVLLDAQVRGDIAKQPRPRAANCLSGTLFRVLICFPCIPEVVFAQFTERVERWNQTCRALQ